MADLWENPMQTDGFEFVEFTAPEPEKLGKVFEMLGFVAVGRHRSKDVTLYRQGDVNLIVNGEKSGFPRSFAALHGASACAIAFRVKDAAKAYKRALEQGAWGVETHAGPMELNIPAIHGIGDSLIYLVDRYGERSIYDVDFVPIAGEEQDPAGVGLTYIDHLTHNVHQGRMDVWGSFYETLFNFREIRYFDIEGKLTGLKSRAMTSPCGKIRIPINESSDDKSQIAEYLDQYKGEGIQHIAMGTDDIFAAVDGLRGLGMKFMAPPPETYYDMLADRLPNHGENLEELKSRGILIDGAPTEDGGLLLQIFTNTVIGPIFFELIQRKGDEGFGEGNFKALFESIEQDQINRGVLKG